MFSLQGFCVQSDRFRSGLDPLAALNRKRDIKRIIPFSLSLFGWLSGKTFVCVRLAPSSHLSLRRSLTHRQLVIVRGFWVREAFVHYRIRTEWSRCEQTVTVTYRYGLVPHVVTVKESNLEKQPPSLRTFHRERLHRPVKQRSSYVIPFLFKN